MSTINEIRKVRIEKLKKLEQAGLNPYPAATKRSHRIVDALANFEQLQK